MAEDIEDLRELWSGPESGWALHRGVRVRHEFFALLGPGPVTAEQLRKLRMLPGQLQDVPLRELKSRIPTDGRVFIGEFEGLSVRPVAEKAEHLGLRFDVVSHCREVYLPVNRKTGMTWLIENAETAQRVAERMLAAGMPVIHMEYD